MFRFLSHIVIITAAGGLAFVSLLTEPMERHLFALLATLLMQWAGATLTFLHCYRTTLHMRRLPGLQNFSVPPLPMRLRLTISGMRILVLILISRAMLLPIPELRALACALICAGITLVMYWFSHAVTSAIAVAAEESRLTETRRSGYGVESPSARYSAPQLRP